MELGQINPANTASMSGMLRTEAKSVTRDEAQLARFGKKQQLKRNFRLLSIIALTCTIMITWEGFLTTFLIGLVNGGPAGVVYGFIFVWIGNILQVLVIAEMASMIPIAGGQYNWVSVLAPRSCSKFLSYLTGWSTFITWQAVVASAAFLTGTVIQNLIILNYPDYDFQRWHGTLLFYAIILIALVINTYLAHVLPQIETVVFLVHFFGFFCVLIPLVYLAPHASADQVFQNFMNNASWPTDGLSFFIGLPGAMFAFVGIDTASHMAEEVRSASFIIPRSMILSVTINGILGFGIMIAILFCLGDVSDLLGSESQYPFIQVFATATKSNNGATAMVTVIIFMFTTATIGCLATSSRMTWAFARERGLPFHQYLSKVEQRTNLPINAIILTASISVLLALINIGSTAAFNALVSLVVASSYSTFALSASVLLHKRLTTPHDNIHWGQFKLGRAGVPIIVLSLGYSAIGIFFSFWPTMPLPQLETMNWSSLVFVVSIVFSMLYWALWGRHVYTGPVVEVVLEHEQEIPQHRSKSK